MSSLNWFWVVRLSTISADMGKGYEENQARLTLLQSFGKDLARRAKSSCELSGKSGVPLRIYEVPPVPKEPDSGRCFMLCDEVIEALSKPNLFKADEWRHLGELIWSEETMVQLVAVRILHHLGKENAWCREVVEEAYLDDEVLEEAAKARL